MGRQNERSAVSGYGNGKYGGNLRMRKQKYRLSLTDTERHLVVQCLLDLRNALIAQGKYTDAVDEVIIKFTK